METVPNKLEGFPNDTAGQRIPWDHYFIMQAMLAAAKSKDDSTWVGVVLVRDNTVIATGFNGFPRHVSETYGDLSRDGIAVPNDRGPDDLIDERWNARPDKYRWVEHAERNAIYQAARQGFSTEGATMYMNTTGQPCADCTRAVIQAGIVEIVTRKLEKPFMGKGEGKHYHCGDIEAQMLLEGFVRRREVEDFAPNYRYSMQRA